MSYVVMAYIVMAYVVMSYVVVDLYSCIAAWKKFGSIDGIFPIPMAMHMQEIGRGTIQSRACAYTRLHMDESRSPRAASPKATQHIAYTHAYTHVYAHV